MKKKTILNIMLVIIVIIGLILLKLEKNNLLKNDYYTYVNKEKLAKKLKRNEYNISSFSIVQDKVDKQTDEIFKKHICVFGLEKSVLRSVYAWTWGCDILFYRQRVLL